MADLLAKQVVLRGEDLIDWLWVLLAVASTRLAIYSTMNFVYELFNPIDLIQAFPKQEFYCFTANKVQTTVGAAKQIFGSNRHKDKEHMAGTTEKRKKTHQVATSQPMFS